MGCQDTIKKTCGRILSSNCVKYVGTFHANTALTECDDPSMTDVIEDINSELNVINEAIDLQNLGDACIDYELVDGKIRVKEALEAIEAKLCELSGMVTEADENGCPLVYSQLIDCVGLELGDLVDPCGGAPLTLADLLQIIINRLP